MNNTALITGSTSGIGEALARRFAMNGFNLVVVSRDESHVNTVSARLEREFGVTVIGLAEDLTDPAAPQRLKQELDSREIQVEVLVNNAGRAAKGSFHEVPLEDQLKMLHLNIEALVRLTRLYLPEFLARGHGKILNVGSIAGFQPGPLLAVYHASKAFVVSFSEAIAEELADSPVSVTCLCPGPTDTEFFARAHMEDSRVAQNESMLADPEDVAAGGYKALMNGDRVYVHGGMNKALTFMRRLMPESIQAKFNERLYESSEKD